jgi:uncharacterized protein (TIGR02145 family)
MDIIVKGSNIITKSGNIITKGAGDIYAPVHGNEFTWDGFTYKVIVKDYGGEIGELAWLDRNLGASRVATASDDSQAYGDYYQWGRLTDGHEKNDSGTTSTLATTNVPGHSNFILNTSDTYDWRNPQNDNLWQGVNGVNNPCPPGWRVPSAAELETERLSWVTNNIAGAYGSSLKFCIAGFRRGTTGDIWREAQEVGYWAHTVNEGKSDYLYIYNAEGGPMVYYSARVWGMSVRCVRTI